MEKSFNLSGDIFIIPNSLASEKNTLGKDESEKRAIFEEWLKNHVDRFLVDKTREEYYVQVWCCSPENDNWAMHSGMPGEQKNFTEFLPVSLFKGKKEGDVIEIETTYWGKIKLTLNQLNYRYRYFGPFETVLERLIQQQ